MKKFKLAEVLAGAKRAEDRIKYWPEWKRALSFVSEKEVEMNKNEEVKISRIVKRSGNSALGDEVATVLKEKLGHIDGPAFSRLSAEDLEKPSAEKSLDKEAAKGQVYENMKDLLKDESVETINIRTKFFNTEYGEDKKVEKKPSNLDKVVKEVNDKLNINAVTRMDEAYKNMQDINSNDIDSFTKKAKHIAEETEELKYILNHALKIKNEADVKFNKLQQEGSDIYSKEDRFSTLKDMTDLIPVDPKEIEEALAAPVHVLSAKEQKELKQNLEKEFVKTTDNNLLSGSLNLPRILEKPNKSKSVSKRLLPIINNEANEFAEKHLKKAIKDNDNQSEVKLPAFRAVRRMLPIVNIPDGDSKFELDNDNKSSVEKEYLNAMKNFVKVKKELKVAEKKLKKSYVL